MRGEGWGTGYRGANATPIRANYFKTMQLIRTPFQKTAHGPVFLNIFLGLIGSGVDHSRNRVKDRSTQSHLYKRHLSRPTTKQQNDMCAQRRLRLIRVIAVRSMGS